VDTLSVDTLSDESESIAFFFDLGIFLGVESI
jgi:hypothetical protein